MEEIRILRGEKRREIEQNIAAVFVGGREFGRRQNRMLLKRKREGSDRLRRRHNQPSRSRPQLQFLLPCSLFLRPLSPTPQGELQFRINFNFLLSTSPYYSKFWFIFLQQRNFLVTIGEDEQISPQQSSMCLKVFDLDKMHQPEATSTSTSSATPDCIGILRIFTNQFPQAKVLFIYVVFLCVCVCLS